MANYNYTLTQQLALQTQQPQQVGGNTILVARVTHVVTGPFIAGTTLRDIFYKNPKDLGKITFQFLKGNQDRTEDSKGNLPAKPLNSAMKHVPVEGEFVQIVIGPSLELNETRGQIDYYYTAPFDLWGAAHHNALADLGDYNQFVNDTVSDYQQNQATNRANNTTVSGSTSMAYPLGPDFYEKSDIKPLRVFTGDVTLEGRWGNSIRFGSTSPNKGTDNYWSQTGSIGNPITIIRNGQGPQLDKTAWIPTVENINRDASSIYLTMGQRIVIDDIQNNFSLASWQTALDSTVTTSIPIQQQLTSYDMISPAAQDQFVNNAVNPTPPTGSNTPATPTGSTTEVPPPPPPAPPPPPPLEDPKGTFRKEYTNSYNNKFELYSKKSGFSTTIYAYQKGTQNLIKTGQSNATAQIDVLLREMELSLVDNNYYF